MEIVSFPAHDGVTLAAAVHRPDGDEPVPALLAASPYRFDNDVLPASPQFLWRETGPIDLYVARGYAYVHLDVRGSGRSGGLFDFLGPNDQRDVVDAITWIAAQPWCDGNVGGIGQSYYCMLQWFMAAAAPPALKCIAAHDGLNDPYRANCYTGGIPGDFFPGYWWQQNRIINRFPANGGPPCDQDVDLERLVAAHPTYDDFWRERCAWELLEHIRIPLYSSGVWAKHQLHTRGNIEGYRRARGPKKLRMSGAPNAWAANAEFNAPDFHERVLLPFYDRYLKGRDTDYPSRPEVEYAVRPANVMRSATAWPPPSVAYRAYELDATPSGSVTSLNDGSLVASAQAGTTSYTYPVPGWVSGVVGFGADGPPAFDPVRRVLTFTTAPLERDLEIAGPIALVLFLSSTARDTDVFAKLSDQSPHGRAETVTRGWLRASHRRLDPQRSTETEPYHSHDRIEPLVPGEIYRLDISLEPVAYRFGAGHRIRIELANGDSAVTEALWTHYYRPDKIGTDTIHHGGALRSRLLLPVDTAN